MKKLVLALMLSLSACATTGLPKLPPAPTNTTVVERDKIVPVLCKTEIARVHSSIETAQQKLKLEDQNAVLRQSILTQKKYIVKLEAGIIGCGGKITNR